MFNAGNEEMTSDRAVWTPPKVSDMNLRSCEMSKMVGDKKKLPHLTLVLSYFALIVSF